VREDVANEFVSPAGAELIYGVAVDPKTMTVDEARTAELRSKPPPEVEVVVQESTLEVRIRRVARA
jgi:hypothetical protein